MLVILMSAVFSEHTTPKLWAPDPTFTYRCVSDQLAALRGAGVSPGRLSEVSDCPPAPEWSIRHAPFDPALPYQLPDAMTSTWEVAGMARLTVAHGVGNRSSNAGSHEAADALFAALTNSEGTPPRRVASVAVSALAA